MTTIHIFSLNQKQAKYTTSKDSKTFATHKEALEYISKNPGPGYEVVVPRKTKVITNA